ncbi:MAG: SPFH domain-containing protein [Defluviitaleaceae bacterium]|nr:SPFH domain-containing protein [Defluviitaleaceae bacterium]
MKAKSITLAIIVVIIATAIAIVLPSLHMIRTEEAAVVRVWGVVDRVLQPGLNFVFWIPNEVQRFDLQVREQSFAFSAYSVDAQNINGYVTVLYQLTDARSAMQVAEQFGSMHNLESRMDGVFLEEIQNVFARKSAMEIVAQRAFLSQEIHQNLTRPEITGQFHVRIHTVSVESIVFSAAFEQAVENRMITEQAMMQAEFERERALVIANQQLEVARLESEAVIVAAQADARALSIMQDAWGDLGTEVREIMLRQQMINSWDGVMPRVVAGGSGAGEMQFIIDGVMSY